MPTLPLFNSIDDLFQPLSLDDFRANYWRRRPVQIKGTPDKFAGLLDVDRFFSKYASHADVDLFAGKVFDEGRFQQISINHAQAEKLFMYGFTIQIEDLHWAHPPLMQLNAGLRDALGIYAAMEAAAFLAAPGVGFGIHFDPNPDIWTLQISGRKKWRYSTEVAVRHPLTQTIVPKTGIPQCDQWCDVARPDPETFEEVIQEPGDLFYFPGGAWHSTETIDDVPSCHVVLSSTNETYADFFSTVLQPLLLRRPEWRDVNGNTSLDDPSIRDGLQHRLQELKSIVADLDADHLMQALAAGRAERTKGAYRASYQRAQNKAVPTGQSDTE